MSDAAKGATLWRDVADRLASRLVHHAVCEEHAETTSGCPFCADRAAFLAYRKAGGTIDFYVNDGPTVSVFDMAPDRHAVNLDEDGGV